ncbi:ALBINO3-like protein 2, chloroplastic [Salvia hispanica]|uniref:ALBINO3-like protein 2, chloroplastic n=1 Tax=Salvia hispanica TaxID=49212 RepID=UPI0020090494|nr:ALBINO3-like protein 2, chloroplastic [Salvia hispanica]
MGLLKLSKLRRCRRLPPSAMSLHHFVCHYSSSSSHSLLASSTSRHHHQYSNNPGCSWELLRHSSPDCLSFNRRFSADPGFSKSDEPLLPVEAAEQDEPFLAVQAVISMLDYYHDLTGFPWWIVISTSTLAMRLALFPITVVQLKKMRRLGVLLPRLPRPFPPPQSGRGFWDQFALFLKEKKAARCPSLFWFISSFAFQVPCFLLWISSIRRMCLDHHPGFDSGGTLWFQNLIEYPHGALGLLFPFCIAGLHVVNVQLSFAKSPLQQLPGSIGSLAKGYKNYLLILTLPLLTAAFSIPQGSLVYWLSNSTLTLIQQSCLRNPTLLMYLGVPKVNTPVEVPTIKKDGSSRVADIAIMTKEGEVHAHTLSPVELVNYSIKVLSTGREDIAIICLRLALEKDPGFVKAMLILGQTLLKKKQFVEAAELFETAISKLIVDGDPTEVEDIDLLILVSQWAGIANVQQGKMEQGLVHLERIARIKEPEDSKSKAHYYDGFLVLSSALANVGREDEALKYLQMAAAYDPSYSVYIEHLKNDSEKPSSDPSNSIK